MKLIRLYLLGYKGFKVLSEIISIYGSHTIDLVIIGEDKNTQNDFSNEIKEICDSNFIKNINRKEDNQTTDLYSLAVGWRWMIDKNRIKNLIVLHDSILPKYRGFNPLVTSLINGDSQIGVTALFASEKFDDGDIIYQSVENISYPIKIKTAIEIISKNYTEVSLEIIKTLVQGKELPRIKQKDKEATYSLWRDENDYHINWTWESIQIKRMIDAVGDPYLNAYTLIEGETIRIIDSEIYEDIEIVNREPGKIIFYDNNSPVVVCGKGLLKITKLVKNKSEYSLNKIRLRLL